MYIIPYDFYFGLQKKEIGIQPIPNLRFFLSIHNQPILKVDI